MTQLKFEGRLRTHAKPAKAISLLSDPDFVSTCVPETSDYKRTGEHFTVKVNVGVSFIKGSFDLDGACGRTKGGARYGITGHGAGSGITLTITFDVKGSATGSDVEWAAAGELSGLISGVGEGILRKESERYIEIIIKNIKDGMDAQTNR